MSLSRKPLQYIQKSILLTDIMDFDKLTLHQAKRLEMDSQVRVLELESSLVKERKQLAALRKQHYQMAGSSEGWEEEVRFNLSFPSL